MHCSGEKRGIGSSIALLVFSSGLAPERWRDAGTSPSSVVRRPSNRQTVAFLTFFGRRIPLFLKDQHGPRNSRPAQPSPARYIFVVVRFSRSTTINCKPLTRWVQNKKNSAVRLPAGKEGEERKRNQKTSYKCFWSGALPLLHPSFLQLSPALFLSL